MGGKCPHRRVKKRRLLHKSARRGKFLQKGDDMIHSELRKTDESNPLPLDEDLPGMGQYYCLHFGTSRMFPLEMIISGRSDTRNGGENFAES